MPRSMSIAARMAMFSQETAECFAILLTISHPELEEPIRVNNSGTDIVRGGDIFVAYSFDIQMPEDTSDRLPEVTLSIDNISQEIVTAIRILPPRIRPTVTVEVVMTSSPTVIEAGPIVFGASSFTYDAMTITCTLAFQPILAEPYPAWTFNPHNSPGLF